MKCIFLLKLVTLIFFILFQIQLTFSFKCKSKALAKLKSNLRSRFRKTEVKIKSEKKDGPLNWNTINDDPMLEGLLKSERIMTFNNNKINNSMSNIANPGQSINNQNIMNQVKKPIYSENQKSKTFRTVSPFEDSTTFNGKKYSQLFRLNSNRNQNSRSGYYGKSRLTR